MGDPEVRGWSDPKPRSVWRYALVVAAAVLAGWWTWRTGIAADWLLLARLLITAGAASLAFLLANAALGRPFR